MKNNASNQKKSNEDAKRIQNESKYNNGKDSKNFDLRNTINRRSQMNGSGDSGGSGSLYSGSSQQPPQKIQQQQSQPQQQQQQAQLPQQLSQQQSNKKAENAAESAEKPKQKVQESSEKQRRPDIPLYKPKGGQNRTSGPSSKDVSTMGNEDLAEEFNEKERDGVVVAERDMIVKLEKNSKMTGTEDISHDNSIDSTTAMSENRQFENEVLDLKSEIANGHDKATQIFISNNFVFPKPFECVINTEKGERHMRLEQVNKILLLFSN